MKHLIIIGARQWGREVYAAAKNSVSYMKGEYDIKGFLDSNLYVLDGLRGDYPPIIGDAESYTVEPDDVFFCAMGEPHLRKHYTDIIENKGGDFATIINPTARINPTAVIGKGSYIGPYSIVSDNVDIGSHCVLQCFNDLGHDVKVGDYVSIESYVFLGGGATVGKMSMLHTKSSVIPHKSIGENCVVGINSVVIRNVPDGHSVFGNPAKRI